MKLIIDISEETYNEVCWRGLQLCPRGDKELVNAIKNGTPLPKGHGDLIDRKALLNRPYEKGGFVEWYDEIKHAPTIIEADEGE